MQVVCRGMLRFVRDSKGEAGRPPLRLGGTKGTSSNLSAIRLWPLAFTRPTTDSGSILRIRASLLPDSTSSFHALAILR